jgi:hypothetical protein
MFNLKPDPPAEHLNTHMKLHEFRAILQVSGYGLLVGGSGFPARLA